MDAEVQPLASSTKPKRRQLRIIFIVLTVLVLAAASGAGVAVVRYAPLEAGSYSGTPDISVPHTDVDDPAGRFHTREVTYTQGAPLQIDFSIRNGGPWGVTILGVPGRDSELFHVTDVQRGVLNRCCAEVEPFAPFALQPGEERGIRLVGVMRGCRDYSPGSATSWTSYRVRYRFLGITREMDVPAGMAISIRVPDPYRCTET